MNDNNSSAVPPEMGSAPPACFLVAVEEDLYQRFRIYVTKNNVSDLLLARRLLNNALREFLDAHAPIEYPISPLEV
jgi:hypothetical protein